MEIIIKKDYRKMCEEAVMLIHRTWKKKKNLVLGLATGKTPLGVYEDLIQLHQKGEMDFSEVRAFSLDEYLGLSHDHPQSFAFYMQQNFFQHINIKKENVYRLSGLPDDIEAHCHEYENKIRTIGGVDIQILGIGRNGHIGFNEPSSSLSSRTRIKTLTEETITANDPFFHNKKEIPRYCLTMGIGTILESGTILLLASGQEKSRAIQQSVEGPITATIPASILQLHPQAKIIIDEDAASLLERRSYYRWVYANKNKVDDFLSDKKNE